MPCRAISLSRPARFSRSNTINVARVHTSTSPRPPPQTNTTVERCLYDGLVHQGRSRARVPTEQQKRQKAVLGGPRRLLRVSELHTRRQRTRAATPAADREGLLQPGQKLQRELRCQLDQVFQGEARCRPQEGTVYEGRRKGERPDYRADPGSNGTKVTVLDSRCWIAAVVLCVCDPCL